MGPDYACAVLFLDLDRFKVINDSLSHTVGDIALIEMARRLEKCTRPGDSIARLGGGRYEVFTPSMREQAVARLRLETDLRTAAERNELWIHDHRHAG